MKRILIAALGFIVLFTSVGCDKKNNYVGLQLYSVRQYMEPLPDALQKVAGAGYKFVELASYDAGKFYGQTPAEFKALAKAAGLDVLCSHTG
ncbi:MAG: sugar phosphate isomerase/epimerase, partial [Bacteroidales bacterium]|nr:sugar phosphate isomerase/epimerase [Bacteroidales bacterium]